MLTVQRLRSATFTALDEKGSSRFSLRRTFSLRSSTSANNGEGGQIAFPSKHKKKTQKYKIVEAKTGQADGISFELVNKQGCFLRVKGTELIPDRDNGSDTNFNKDVTFVPLPDMWFPSFFAFESVSKPSYFVRLLPEEELVLDKYDGTKDFKKDASFRLSKKPDATILKKDVQAWVKSTNGEYYLGKILFVNDDMVKVEFTDGRQERCLRSESYKLIPDIVPCPTNLRVGVRVISQFGHRHRFYPGVISSVRRNDSYDILFDDGDCGRGKSYQMRLMQNFPINTNQEDFINKENKPPASPFHHSAVKLVFSDPGSAKEWPKFEIGSPSVTSDTTSCTSTGEVSLKPTAMNSHHPKSNGYNHHNNGNGGHHPSPRWEIESFDDDDVEHLKNGGQPVVRHQSDTRRRKHGWVPSPLTTEINSDPETNKNGNKLSISEPDLPFPSSFLLKDHYHPPKSHKYAIRSLPCSPKCNTKKHIIKEVDSPKCCSPNPSPRRTSRSSTFTIFPSRSPSPTRLGASSNPRGRSSSMQYTSLPIKSPVFKTTSCPFAQSFGRPSSTQSDYNHNSRSPSPTEQLLQIQNLKLQSLSSHQLHHHHYPSHPHHNPITPTPKNNLPTDRSGNQQIHPKMKRSDTLPNWSKKVTDDKCRPKKLKQKRHSLPLLISHSENKRNPSNQPLSKSLSNTSLTSPRGQTNLRRITSPRGQTSPRKQKSLKEQTSPRGSTPIVVITAPNTEADNTSHSRDNLSEKTKLLSTMENQESSKSLTLKSNAASPHKRRLRHRNESPLNQIDVENLLDIIHECETSTPFLTVVENNK